MGAHWYWISLLVYSLLMIGIGFFIRGRRRAQDDHHPLGNLEFWIAKRQLPGWRLAVSLTTGWLMLGWVGFGMAQIYLYGATALWILPIPWFILCWIVIWMVPYVRRIGAVSLPQAFQMRYGPAVRTLLALLSFAVFMAWNQAELFMAGTLMSPFMHVPPWVCMALFILPPIIYTYLGGFRAVVTTELFQFAIMAVFMIVLAAVGVQAAHQASGGHMIEALRRAAPVSSAPGQALNLWFLGALFPLTLLIGYLPGWLIEQDLLLRVQAARSTREAYKGGWWGLLLITVFIIVLPNLAAFGALVAYPPAGGAPPEAIGKDALGIISTLVQRLPLWASVFMFIGVVACQMSTIDTFANVSALAFSYDVVEPWLGQRRFSWKQRLGAARTISVLVLLLTLVLALFSTSLNDVYYISSGVLSACIAVPAIFMFWRRTTRAGVLAAAAAGLLGSVGGYFFEMKFLQSADPAQAHFYKNVLPAWMHGSFGYNYVAAGVVFSAVTIVVVSLLTQPSSAMSWKVIHAAPVDNFQDFLGKVYPELTPAVAEVEPRQ